MSKKYAVTVIILDYKKAKRVVKNIETLLNQEVDFSYKVLIADNSCDQVNADILKKLEKYENVSVFINKKNLGYTTAHNTLSKHIEGNYVLIVNPDILWKDSKALQKMHDYMQKHKDVGILGAKQMNDDGSTAMTVRAFPQLYLQVSRRTFLRYFPILKSLVAHDEMRHLDYNKTQEVDWLQSSCVLVRKDLWDDIGGFDEDYRIFMADTELCLQVKKRGYKVVYFADTELQADGKRSSRGGVWTFFWNWILRQHLWDAIMYQKKRWKEH